MPIYTYRCETCDNVEDAFNSIEERENGPECCGKVMKKFIGNYSIIKDLEPYLDHHIGKEPTWIKSKKHREKVMKENGVFENYGKGWK